MEVKVLDNGFARLVDFVGGDRSAATSARISTMTKGDEKDDAKLVRYLIKMQHGTPFEHSYFTFYIKCPLLVARQWFRHRISSYNEMSMRYVLADRDYYVPADLSDSQREMYVAAVENSFDTYEELVQDELRKELARGVLPVSTYTQFCWTVNARALMNFLELRLDVAAQYEIRQYAKALHGFFQEKMPYTAQAFEDLIVGNLETPRTKKDL